MMLIYLLAAAVVAGADSTVYPILNHDRLAGTMVVTRTGDSVRVRYMYTDRNRGTRLEMRYVIRGDSVLSLESRPVLPDDRAGDPTIRVEIVGDSVRQWTAGRTVVGKAEKGTYYTITFTPFDQARLAKHLLRQADHTARLSANSVAHLEIVAETTVPTSHGTERVRLVTIANNNGNIGSTTPQALWLDSHDDLFASEISWFMTVKPGADVALPTLRKVEMTFRDSQAEALNKKIQKTTNGTIAIKNGDLFDSERGVMMPRTTVIV
ncbi:MAG TPA: hypothetical protein VK636_07205, partial [Gemmatimonadaceae bacterium]|nr:hypothetical protein [Gemmatimonadaceae bacterium]